MWNVHHIAVGLPLLTGLFVAGQEPCVAREPAPTPMKQVRQEAVVIALRPNIQVAGRVIRLGDVALISGGDATFREQLKQLDLEDMLPTGDSVTILPQQIEFRLRVAGIDVRRVSLRGTGSRVTAGSIAEPREVELTKGTTALIPSDNRSRASRDLSGVSIGEGPLEHQMIQAAKACLLSKLPWDEENVDIRLAQPVSADIRQASSAENYKCSAELRTVGPPVGRVQVRVVAEAPQKPPFDISIAFDVRHFETVVLTTKSLERGHTITAADVYVDRQDVTDLADYYSTPKELIGMTTKRAVRSLIPLHLSDIEAISRTEKSLLIRRREQVKMVARVGGLNITATGEALQDGHLGEVIQLRNLDSKANVQGRVISAGEVEISF